MPEGVMSDGQFATGSFRSPKTGRVVQLFPKDGEQMLRSTVRTYRTTETNRESSFPSLYGILYDGELRRLAMRADRYLFGLMILETSMS